MKITSTITINRPVEQVWTFFDNPDNMHKWLRGFERFEQVSGTPGQPGAKARHHYKEGKREIILEEEITERIENELFKGKLNHQSMDSDMIVRFEPVEGGTRMQCEVDTRFKSLGFKILGPLMKGMFQKRQDTDFNKFKEVAENEIEV